MVEEASSSSTSVDNSNNEEIPPYLREEPPEGTIMLSNQSDISEFRFKLTTEKGFNIETCIFLCLCLSPLQWTLINMGYNLYPTFFDVDVLVSLHHALIEI